MASQLVSVANPARRIDAEQVTFPSFSSERAPRGLCTSALRAALHGAPVGILGLLCATSLLACVPELGVAPPVSTSTECNPDGYEVLAKAFPACDPFTCSDGAAANARCVGKDFIQPASQLDSLARCHDDNGQELADTYCVPVPFLIHNGRYQPPTCRSIGNLEGRCLSKCLPAVQAQLTSLPRDSCAEDELCAPCYDPAKHELTAACNINSCDAPPADEPNYCALDYAAFPAVNLAELALCPQDLCPGGGAHCIGTISIPDDQLAKLADCNPTSKCVPDEILVTGGNLTPQNCRANGGVEGRCQSLCLPEVAKNARVLEQAECGPGQACVPCYDPSSNNKDTGACTASDCDAPVEPPVDVCKLDYDAHPLADPKKLPACPKSICPSGNAHCVQIDEPTGQQDKLASCDDGSLCVPDALIRTGGNRPPKTCRAFDGKAEGRCQSLCVPDVADQKEVLEQGVCAADELCAPCFDPRTGKDTGACSGNCDQPVQAPFRFDLCCNDLATCVPSRSVPESKRGSFKTCEGTPNLCVPKEYLDDPDYQKSCSDDQGSAGACVSSCLNNVELVGKPDIECPPNALCVPCKSEIPLLSDIIKSIIGGDGAIDTGACAAGP